MRVYLPLTVTMLRAAVAAGEVRSVIAYAVTPGLREWYAEGDQDELEYTALTAAARESCGCWLPIRPRRDGGSCWPSTSTGSSRGTVRNAAPSP